MATPITPYEDPLFRSSADVPSPVANPFGFNTGSGTPDWRSQIDQLGDMGVAMANRDINVAPPQPTTPTFAFNRATNQFFVQGAVLDGDDAQGLLEAESLLANPPTGLPQTGEWTPLNIETYQDIVSRIRKPSTGRLMGENFAIGIANLKQLGGSALQLAGFEETGAGIIEGAERTQQKLEPFQREFTDIEFGSADRGVIDWFVATLGQQGPMLLESVAASIVGAAAGTVTAGPGLGTAGGAVAGFFGKKAFKDSVTKAAQAYRAGKATADDVRLLKNASMVTGATAANFASGQVIGAGDIYGEMRAEGTSPDDMSARMIAIAGSFPYALAENIVEFGIAARLLGAGGRAALPAGTSAARRGVEVLRRGAGGAVKYGVGEGVTEVSQEALVMGLSGQDLTSDEAVKRFVNSFAAGAAVGGALGGVANLRSKQPEVANAEVNLLTQPEDKTSETVEPLTESVEPGTIPPGVYGPQGELFLDTDYAATMGDARVDNVTPWITPDYDLLAAPTVDYAQADPRQGALQFGQPAPEPVSIQPNALQLAMQRAQQRQVVEQQQAAEAAQREAELNQLANIAQAQRQLEIAEAAQQEAAQQQELAAQPQQPLSQAGPSVPQQQSLFARGELPVPSMRERLRRGIPPLLRDESVAATPRTDLRRSRQIPLFTQDGDPSLPAARSAARRQAFIPVLEVGGTQIPDTGRSAQVKANQLKAQKDKAAADKAAKAKAAQVAKEKQDRQAQEAREEKELAKKAKAEWDDKRSDTAPTWNKLKDTQRSEWSTLVSKGKASMAEADRVAGIKPPEPPPTKKGVAKLISKPADVKATPVGDTKLKKSEPKAEATTVETPRSGLGLASMVAQVTGAPQINPITGQPIEVETKKSTTQGVKGADTFQVEEDLMNAINLVREDPNEFSLDFGDNMNYILNQYYTAVKDTFLKNTATRFLFGSTEFDAIPEATFRRSLKTYALTRNSISPRSNLYKDLEKFGLLEDEAIVKKFSAKDKPTAEQDVDVDVVLPKIDSATNELINMIENRIGVLNKTNLRAKAKSLFNQVSDQEFSLGARGVLSDFFDTDGNPYIRQRAGTNSYILSTEAESEQSVADYKKAQKEAREDLEALADEIAEEDRELALRAALELKFQQESGIQEDDNYLGNLAKYYRVDEQASKPISVGALKLHVQKFVSKLSSKPNVQVFKNLEDMRVTNPKMFSQAAAARKAGDLEATNAAGMAWGKNVVLFADNINGRKHGEFVLAHEILGHVGFRGLFNNTQLDKLLDSIAKKDKQLHNAATVLSEAQDIPFLEAVEEVLSDRAAVVDTNTIIRFWNWMKNQLNKLGFKFDDDASRYLIGLSRKYIRNGTGLSEVNLENLLQEVATARDLERSDVEVLRYSVYAPQGQQTAAMNALNSNRYTTGNLEGIFNWLSNKGPEGELRKVYDRTTTGLADTMKNVSALFRTQDDMARDSKGAAAIFSITQRKGEMQQRLKSMYARMTETAHKAKLFGYGEGATDEQRERAGQLLALGSANRMNKISDAKLQSMYAALLKFSPETGDIQLDKAAFDTLAKLGTISVEEFKKGFSVQMGSTEKPMTPEIKAELEAKRDQDIAEHEARTKRELDRVQAKIDAETDPRKKVKLQDAYNDLEDKFANQLRGIKMDAKKNIDAGTYDAPNMVESKTMKEFDWVKDLTEDSLEYKMYLEFRNAINQSQVDVLEAKFNGARFEQKRSLDRGIARAFSRPLNEAEQTFITAVANEYDRLAMENAEYKNNRFVMSETSRDNAEVFAERRFAPAFYNDNALKDFTKLVPGYTQEQVETLVTGLKEKLRTKINLEVDKPGDSTIWPVAYAIRERNSFTVSLNDDSLYAKRSIAGGYTDFARRGDFQVRVQAYTVDSNGNDVPVKLKQGQQDSLAFFMTKGRAEAQGYARELNNILQGEYTMRDSDGKPQQVFLRSIVGDTPKGPSLVDIMHYDDVQYALSRLGISLSAPDQELIIKKVTAQNAKARDNLQRANVPGWDKDVIRSASAFLEKQAYVASNKTFRHQFDSVFEDDDMWLGNPDREAELKAKMDAATGEMKNVIAREYNQERYYNKKARQKVEGVDQTRGQWFRNRSLSFVDWQNSSADIIHADDMWSNNKFTLTARTLAAVTQLGGSISLGIIQVMSLPMNSWVYVSSYNPDNNYGIGLGASKAGYLLSKMAVSAANPNYIKVDFLEKQIADLEKSGNEFNSDGINLRELQFLKDLTEEQRLDAAQFNALTATSRGREVLSNPNWQKFVQLYMTPFNYTEQFNRRVTVLATYRGVYENQIAAGITPEEADKAARIAADKALDATQGDYSQYNRPAFFRGGPMSFVYMYKQFPIMMVQILKNLDYRGKIMMLGTILLMSGIRGIPFADDLKDLVDSLLQMLRIGSGSLEKDFTRFMKEALGPDLGKDFTPVVLRGLLDTATGWSFSSRLGLGDIIPGTGLLKPTSSPQQIIREIENLAGAPTSFLTGAYSWLTDTVPGAVTGRKPLLSLLSESPVRAIKNLGDATRFTNAGAILDTKGYIVAPEATNWEILGKAIGFYPSRAQVQMDWMMADDQEQRYGQMIRSEAVRDAVTARMVGDREAERQAEKFVSEWNKVNSGTRLEIRGFNRAVNIAYREATKPLAARALKSSARAGRDEAEQLAAMYGFEVK